MEKWTIDINCDVGEGVGNETSLFPLISSCNVACGGHAGDLQSMKTVVKLAKQHNIKIGAHPSYPDKPNFGREVMDISEAELRESISAQLEAFMRVLGMEGVQLHHIKAHGALYNETAKSESLAGVYLETVQKYKENALLYVPFGSVIAKMALDNGFKVCYEAFADRNYNSDLSLISRKQANALIQEPKKVLTHVLPIIKEGEIVTMEGEKIGIQVDTLCIHGDTPSALQILMYLSEQFPQYGVQLQK